MNRWSLLLLWAAVTACAQAPDPPKPRSPLWSAGAFADAAYLLDFNHPANNLFRNRGTAFHVDELDLNMAGAYVKKIATDTSRWGTELTIQGGKDSAIFGFSATAPNLEGSTGLRHLGPFNVSYLAPAGKGLTIQAGFFSSFVGYDSLYAKDNLSYTRPWGADYTPYMMFGVNAGYSFNDRLSATLFLVNGYWHLAHANDVPSTGGQIVYKATSHVTLKETMLYGPHQSDTSLEFWRYLSDTIVEWKGSRLTTAFEYQLSEEKVDALGKPRAWWTSAQWPIHYTIHGPWSATARPEFAYDSDGRWTTSQQFIKAITSTLEYRVPYRKAAAIFRLEHRYDNSHGRSGGFFRGTGLTPGQHLLVFGAIFTIDSPLSR